jgi:Uncharacterized conserved protein
MSVTLAQVLLVVLIAALVGYVFTVRSMFTDRLAMLVVAAAGCILVAWPGLSTDVARAIGIGRGTDLVLYLFVVFCLFRFVSTAAGMRRLEERLTRVVRDAALHNARPVPKADYGPAMSTRPGEPR